MKKYQASPGYFPTIEVIDVERESKTHVWVDGTKARKESIFMSCHDTFEQAKLHLFNLATADINAAADHLERTRIARDRILELVTPV